MVRLYVIWYGIAVVLNVGVWRWSRRVQRPWLRRLVRTAALAFGFTTVPLGRDDQGGLYPVGLFYLARSDRIEAATAATLVIGVVCATLYAVASLGAWLRSGLGRLRGTR
jgi:hypothetical protein